MSNEISIKWQSTKIMYGSITRIIVNPSIFNYTLSTPFFLLREFSLWIKMEWIEEKVGILVLWLFLVNGTDHSLVYHKYFLLKINVGVSEQWPPLPFTWIVSTCSQWHITHIWWLSHLVVVTFGGCHIWWLSHLVVVFQSWLQKKKNETKKGRIIFIVKFIPTIFVMHIHSISNQTVIQWSKSLPYLEIVWNKVWSTSSKLYQS